VVRIPINYVGHAEQWDEIAIGVVIKAKHCLLRYKKNGKVLAVRLYLPRRREYAHRARARARFRAVESSTVINALPLRLSPARPSSSRGMQKRHFCSRIIALRYRDQIRSARNASEAGVLDNETAPQCQHDRACGPRNTRQ